MSTWRVDGTAPLQEDLALVVALMGVAVVPGPGGLPQLLGLLNREGEVYRLVQTTQLALHLKRCAQLERLGFCQPAQRPRALRLTLDDVYAPPPWPVPALARAVALDAGLPPSAAVRV